MDPSVTESLEAARRKGFNQGMSAALAFLSVGTTGWVLFAILKYVPEFEKVLPKVHMEIPTLTILVLNHYVVISILVLVSAGVAVWVTVTRGDRPVSLFLNIAAFLLALSWLAVCVV